MYTTYTELYCEKLNGIYEDFYPSILQVEMCGAKKEDIVKVRVREPKRNEINTHWGWWDNENEEFCMIFIAKCQVEICFPYGFESEEKLGRGKLCRIVVEEIQ